MPAFIDILPEALFGLIIGFLLMTHILNRFKIPYRVTFYFKTSGHKVSCILADIETKNNGNTISWKSPAGWPQSMLNIEPSEIVAIKVKDRRRSFCL